MKKIIGVLGVAVIAATMFFNTNAVNGSSSDTNLANLLTLNSANAECVFDIYHPEFNTGKCGQLSGMCFWQGSEFAGDCDPTAPNQG